MSKSKKEPSHYPLHGQMSRIDWKPRTKHTKLSIFKSRKFSIWFLRYKNNMLKFRTAKKFWNGQKFAKREWRMHCCQKQLTMNEIDLNLCFASSYKYIIKFKIFEKFSINIMTRCDNCLLDQQQTLLNLNLSRVLFLRVKSVILDWFHFSIISPSALIKTSFNQEFR